MKNDIKKSCSKKRGLNKELLNELLALREELGHETIKKLFKAYKKIREAQFRNNGFPLSLLYRVSLCQELKNGIYSGKSINEVANSEEVNKRYVYRAYHHMMEGSYNPKNLASKNRE